MATCLEPGCHELVRRGRCATHAKKIEMRRGSAASRGYGYRWTKYRAWFLNYHPLCGDRPAGAPTTPDSKCREIGRLEVATVVDHIVPVQGPNDPSFYKPEGHQSLCEACHNAKRARESQQSKQWGV